MGFHKDQYLDLFCLPSTPLYWVISSAIIVWISTFMLMIHNFIYHLSQTAISQVEVCIKDIKTWMTNNLLKLNDDKTELVIIATSETTSRQEDIVINIGDSPIAPSMEPPRNLGVLFNSICCLNDHVNKICQNINYQLYSIGKIRKYLDKPTTEIMINSAVTSRLDYCNSLLYGINWYLVSQLQRCQNNAARIVSLRIERSTLAASWAQIKLQDPVAGLQGSTWHGSTLLVIATVALQTWEVSAIWG